MSKPLRAHIIALSTAALLFTSAVYAAAPDAESREGGKRRGGVPPAFRELIDLSLNDKVGLTFFMNGQSLPAIVTKIGDDGTVEGRSQEYGRIVIRLHQVNAIAKQ